MVQQASCLLTLLRPGYGCMHGHTESLVSPDIVYARPIVATSDRGHSLPSSTFLLNNLCSLGHYGWLVLLSY